MAMKFFLGVSSLAALLQLAAVPASNDMGSILATAEHLTLTGALIIAVVILWKSLLKKEELLLKTTETVTAALATATSSNNELRKAVEESVAAKEHLVGQVAALTQRLNQR